MEPLPDRVSGAIVNGHAALPRFGSGDRSAKERISFRAEGQRSFPTIPSPLQSFEAHFQLDRRHPIQGSFSGLSLSAAAILEFANYEGACAGNLRKLLRRP